MSECIRCAVETDEGRTIFTCPTCQPFVGGVLAVITPREVSERLTGLSERRREAVFRVLDMAHDLATVATAFAGPSTDEHLQDAMQRVDRLWAVMVDLGAPKASKLKDLLN